MERIITISRQFGSGGHEIAKRLSKRLELPFYDKDILRIVEEKTHYSEAYLLENEEQVPSLLNGPYYGNSHTSFYPQISTDKVFFSISHVLKDIAAKAPASLWDAARIMYFMILTRLNFLFTPRWNQELIASWPC